MKVALLGDIAPFGRYCSLANPEICSAFDAVADFLRGHDVVVGNLETPFISGEKRAGSKSAHISCHPENAALLRHLGVTHVTLANNHIGDFGTAGYERTKAVLADNDIGWFGTEGRSLRLEAKGQKIALSGYCSLNTNPAQVRVGNFNVLNLLDVDSVVREMRENDSLGYFNIVSVHSGQEHVHTPSAEDVAFARSLSAEFDYVYYGHHPHVVQGMERIAGSALLYSLGNFIFDDVFTPRDPVNPLVRLSEANRTGIVASLEISDGRVVGASVHPIYIGRDHVLFDAQVPDFDMSAMNAALEDAGSAAYDSAREASIKAYLDERRSRRDLNWYLRRLNANSVGIILAARRNARRHNDLFSAKLIKRGPAS